MSKDVKSRPLSLFFSIIAAKSLAITSNWGLGNGSGTWMNAIVISWNCVMHFCLNTLVSYPTLYV